MDKYAHITKMETIRVQQDEMLRELNRLLDAMEEHRQEYKDLITYYYSQQREQDLRDDAAHLIPETLSRGVLSEDGIFDLVGDYRDTAIRMLEIGVGMVKE